MNDQKNQKQTYHVQLLSLRVDVTTNTPNTLESMKMHIMYHDIVTSARFTVFTIATSVICANATAR